MNRYPLGLCFTQLLSVQALPDWAQQTLQAHAADPRPQVMTDEQLDKGETGDVIWDAAQYQLALTGGAFARVCPPLYSLLVF